MTATLDERSGGGAPPGWQHPLAAALSAVEAALDEVADTGCWSLPDRELAGLVGRAHTVAARVGELGLRLVAEAGRRDPGQAFGAMSTAGWLRSFQRVSYRTARAQIRLAAQLDAMCPVTRAALAAGVVHVEQAGVIAAAIARLPKEVTEDQRLACEAHLVDQAATFDADDLKLLGRRVWEVIDPDGVDEVEGRLLEREEAEARAKATLRMAPSGDGSTRGRFVIPDAQADMLKVALESMISPRRPGADRPEQPPGDPDPALDAERLPYPQRLGLAFCELIEHLPVDALPQAGRSTPTVTVTMDLDALRSGLGAATLSTGTKLSASQARRIACNAGLVPQVLAGESVVLDSGRGRRFHDHHQRRAIATAQRGCVADSCDRPPAWCEVHHPIPWSQGGRTDVTGDHGGVLLCGRHHHLVHDVGWSVVWATDHIPELVPPAHVDPTRTPVRHRRFTRRRPGRPY